MTRKRHSRLAGRGVFLFVVIFVFASSASAEWKEKVLYSFQGGTDGATPVGAVVFDQQGNLYGATQNGGSSSCHSIQQCGTVYRLAPPAKQGDPWTETVLYVFKGNASNDGASPYGGLVIDSAGNLYGTTGYGGTGDCEVLGSKLGCGTVFELTPPKQKGDAWTETVLHSFPNAKQGFNPFGDLVFDSAGNLYGATFFGGGKGTTCDPYYQYCGSVFELSPPKTKGGKWTERKLYSFEGVAQGAQVGDGANPNGGLVLDNKGAIYGTTFYGGSVRGECNGGSGGTGCGTVFKLAPPAKKDGNWTQILLRRFDEQDGDNPAAGVVVGANGDLYGTTLRGGSSGGPGGGTVFRMVPPSKKSGPWKETILYNFTGDEHGTDPMASLLFDSVGNLYSTTNGGTPQCHYGNVFRMKPASENGQKWTLSVLYGFTGSPGAEYPAARLAFDKTGNLYSTTSLGGTAQSCQSGCGTVFEVSP